MDITDYENPIIKQVQNVLKISLNEDLFKVFQTFETASINVDDDIERQIDELRVKCMNKELDIICDIQANINSFNEKSESLLNAVLNFQNFMKNNQMEYESLKLVHSMLKEREELINKRNAINLLANTYLITEKDKHLITDSTILINESFFVLLDKLKKLTAADALTFSDLLKNDDNINFGQKVDLSNLENLLNDTQLFQSIVLWNRLAYEKLLKWLKNELRNFSMEMAVSDPIVTNALQYIKEHSKTNADYYKKYMEIIENDYITIRKSNFSSNFIKALTQGGPHGVPKPIELHVHDPIRYSGDILAWVHAQSLVEQEIFTLFLQGLKDDYKDNISNYLGNIVEGICPNLKVRIEQIIAGESDLIILYKLLNLLKFYVHHVFAPHICAKISSNSDDINSEQTPMFHVNPSWIQFNSTLTDLIIFCMTKLKSLLKYFVKQSEACIFAQSSNDNILTEEFVHTLKSDAHNKGLFEITALLKGIFEAAKNSLLPLQLSVNTTNEFELNKNNDFIEIMEMLTPTLVRNICGDETPTKLNVRKAANILNSYYYVTSEFNELLLMETALNTYIHKTLHDLKIKIKYSECIDFLSYAQYEHVFAKTGLTIILATLNQLYKNDHQETQGEVSTNVTANTDVPDLVNYNVSSFLLFDQYLSAPDLYTLKEIASLHDINTRDIILTNGQNLITKNYEIIYTILTLPNMENDGDEKNKQLFQYIEKINHSLLASNIFLKTPEQIMQLLFI